MRCHHLAAHTRIERRCSSTSNSLIKCKQLSSYLANGTISRCCWFVHWYVFKKLRTRIFQKKTLFFINVPPAELERAVNDSLMVFHQESGPFCVTDQLRRMLFCWVFTQPCLVNSAWWYRHWRQQSLITYTFIRIYATQTSKTDIETSVKIWKQTQTVRNGP